MRNSILLFLVFCAGVQFSFGQQFPVSNQYLYRPWLFNPASVGFDSLHTFFLSHQSRKANWEDASYSQIFNYSSKPFSTGKNLGWGLMAVNDREDVLNRVQLSAALSYALISDGGKRLTIGGSAGLINLSWDLRDRVVRHQADPLLSLSNQMEIDAAIGMDFRLSKPKYRIRASAAMSQLPGSFLSGIQNSTLELIPHLMVYGGGTYLLQDSIGIGPYVFYKDVYRDDYSLGGGNIDAGLKVDFFEKGLWFGGGYRINQAALHGAFGLRLFRSVNPAVERPLTRQMDLSFQFELPMGALRPFGPSFEVGLGVAFGRPPKEPEVEIRWRTEDRGPFWQTTSNINYYMMRELEGKIKPAGLIARAKYEEPYVMLIFEWDDDVVQFDYEHIPELMNLVEFIIGKVIKEAMDPEEGPYLKSLDYIALEGYMQFDTVSAIRETDIQYQSELGDTVRDPYFYDGNKYHAFIPFKKFLTNKDLALLKLLSIRTEFWRYPMFQTRLQQVQIFSDNPNQGTYQHNKITIRFKDPNFRNRRKD